MWGVRLQEPGDSECVCSTKECLCSVGSRHRQCRIWERRVGQRSILYGLAVCSLLETPITSPLASIIDQLAVLEYFFEGGPLQLCSLGKPVAVAGFLFDWASAGVAGDR